MKAANARPALSALSAMLVEFLSVQPDESHLWAVAVYRFRWPWCTNRCHGGYPRSVRIYSSSVRPFWAALAVSMASSSSVNSSSVTMLRAVHLSMIGYIFCRGGHGCLSFRPCLPGSSTPAAQGCQGQCALGGGPRGDSPCAAPFPLAGCRGVGPRKPLLRRDATGGRSDPPCQARPADHPRMACQARSRMGIFLNVSRITPNPSERINGGLGLSGGWIIPRIVR